MKMNNYSTNKTKVVNKGTTPYSWGGSFGINK